MGKLKGKEKTVEDVLHFIHQVENPEWMVEIVERMRWIPVSERLPDKPEENPVFENKPLELYLVSIRGADYPIRAFWNGKYFTDGWSKLDVAAWMPLPEPYKDLVEN